MPRADVAYRAEQEWILSVVPNFSGGLNTTAPMDLLDDQEAADCENVVFRDNKVRSETGYKKLGGVVRGTIRAAFQHETASGTVSTLLVTDVTVYRFVAATMAWHALPYAALGASGHTKLNGAHAGGATTLNVDSNTGFAAADFIAIELDNGQQHQTTVASIPGAGQIEITVGLPSAAADDKDVFEPVILTGNSDNQVVILGIPATEWTVFTNGVNVPQRYDGSTVEAIPNLPSGGNVICRTMALYKNHLVLGNLVEGGVSKPYSVRWNADGDFTNWTTGDAGANALADTRDPIKALAPLADDLIIYRTRSLAAAQHIGLPLEPFSFTQIVFGESVGGKGIGAVSPLAVYPQHDRHYFLSIDGVYEYRGGITIREVSTKIHRGIFGVGGLIDPTKLHRAIVHYADGSDELFVFYTAAGSSATYPDQMIALDMQQLVAQREVWRRRKFQKQIACVGTRTSGETVRIIDLIGTIAAQIWVIGSGATSQDQPELLIGGPDLQPWLYDFFSTTDDGLVITSSLKTKVFRSTDRTMRYDFFEVNWSGAVNLETFWTVHRSVSPNMTLGIVTGPTGTVNRYRFYRQVVTEDIQFTFIWSGVGELGRFSMKHKEASRWEGQSSTVG